MTSGLLKNNEKVCISVYGMRVKCCVAYNLLFNLNRMREKKKIDVYTFKWVTFI